MHINPGPVDDEISGFIVSKNSGTILTELLNEQRIFGTNLTDIIMKLFNIS